MRGAVVCHEARMIGGWHIRIMCCSSHHAMMELIFQTGDACNFGMQPRPHTLQGHSAPLRGRVEAHLRSEPLSISFSDKHFPLRARSMLHVKTKQCHIEIAFMGHHTLHTRTASLTECTTHTHTHTHISSSCSLSHHAHIHNNHNRTRATMEVKQSIS